MLFRGTLPGTTRGGLNICLLRASFEDIIVVIVPTATCAVDFLDNGPTSEQESSPIPCWAQLPLVVGRLQSTPELIPLSISEHACPL